MSKKIVSVLLSLLFLVSLSVSVDGSAIDFVIDETGGYLDESELKDLNEYAAELYERCGTGIFFVYTDAPMLEDYDVESLTGGLNDYYVMLENDTSWYTCSKGLGANVLPETDEKLREDYDADPTFFGAVWAVLEGAASCIPEIGDVPAVEAPEEEVLDVGEQFLYDDADLVPDGQEADLVVKLMEVSHKYDAQVVVATIPSMDGGDINAFVGYLYDALGLGYGENYDGVLLLVCMDPREYRILSNGFAGAAIDPDDISSIGEEIVPDLSAGNYTDSFEVFVEQVDYYLNGYLYGFPFDTTKNLGISLVVGIIAGVIVAFVLKGQLKSVRKQYQANDYVRPGSMQVTVHNDYFLYRTVTRTRKQSDDSGGSGRGSSGSSRSVGGGSF